MLTTYQQNDGAVVGSHLITVRKVTADRQPPGPVAEGEADGRLWMQRPSIKQ